MIAFEPITATFKILAANVAAIGVDNVTLINAAASQRTRVARMTIPKFASGLENYYEAQLDESRVGAAVPCVAIDGLGLENAVRLVKVDTEGHELSVLQGMMQLIERDRPILIIEGQSEEVAQMLVPLGYHQKHHSGSPNTMFMVATSGASSI